MDARTRSTERGGAAAAGRTGGGAALDESGASAAAQSAELRGATATETGAASASALAGGGSAVCVAPTRTVGVPAVVDLARIPDAVNRNQAINQSYHAFDTAMSDYMGQPLVANWCTFGQHASREAGEQIRNLQGGLQVLRDGQQILISVALAGGNPAAILGEVRRTLDTLRRIIDLAGQPTLLAQSMQLAMAKAGITVAEVQAIIDSGQDVISFSWTDLIPGAQAVELIRFVANLTPVVAKLLSAIPAIITAVERVYENMKRGNREIYENIAPAYSAFLTAANGAAQNQPGSVRVAGDPQGFVAAAFVEYAHCRRLADELVCNPGAPDAGAKTAERQQRAHRGNLLIGFQEQLVILQPIFDTMQDELRAMSGTMSLRDPTGIHPLIGNWGDFYTRMGIDPARAPADPRTITPATLPPVLRPGQPGYAGTINQYFSDGLNSSRTHEAPRAVRPM